MPLWISEISKLITTDDKLLIYSNHWDESIIAGDANLVAADF